MSVGNIPTTGICCGVFKYYPVAGTYISAIVIIIIITITIIIAAHYTS